MREANRKQKLLLTALGLAWGLLLGWQFLQSEEPVRLPLKNRTGMKAASHQAAASDLHVNLELLAAPSGQRDTTFTTPRNIFSSLAGKEMSAQTSAHDLPLEQLLPTPAEERKLAAAAELNRFRYLGFLRFGDRKGRKKENLAVLLREDELHMVHAGDTIEKQVLVRSITSEGVTLQHLTSRVVQVVPVAQEPLTETEQN
jgi:hypothetical protein